MIIILFFFSFIATVIVQMFALAYRKSELARDINSSIIVLQNYAEAIKSQDKLDANNLSAFPEFEKSLSDANTYVLYLDAENQKVSDENDSRFKITVTLRNNDSSAGRLVSGKLIAYKLEYSGGTASNEILAEFDIANYYPFK